MAPHSMKAVLIRHAGGPEVLSVETVPVPSVSAGRLLIRVKAFGLNRSEMFTRQGHSPVQFPRIPGIEAVGIVEELGSGVTDFAVGDKVATAMGGLGREFDGGYAEYTCPPASNVQHLDTTLSWEVLGALPEMLQTAWGSLYRALQLRQGDCLLVRGGTTSVGLAAAALAKQSGATVIATSRSPEREAFVKANGAHHFLLDDGKLADKVKQIAPGGVDKVLELIGVTTMADSLACTKAGGIVCITGIVGNKWTVDGFDPLAYISTGVYLTTYRGGSPEFMATPLQDFVKQVEQGTLPVQHGPVFKIDDIVEAHKLMESNQASGKIVVLT